jgi:hypothetical protein
MSYAILDINNVVVELVAHKPSDSVRSVKSTPNDGCAVGRVWNGWSFDAKRWTAYVFLRRFTVGERDAIRVAAANDGAVADLMMFLQTATEVVADDDTTAVGMDYLVHLGILTPARRAELLS